MNKMKRAFVLLVITLIITLLTASAVLAAYGPQRAPSGSGSTGGSSSDDGGSSGGGGGGGGGGCATGYILVNKTCVKTEVSAVAEETPSETPTGAATEQSAVPEVSGSPAEQELLEVKPISNLAWLLPFAVITLLVIAAVLYWYRKQSQSRYKPKQRKRD